MTMFLKRLKQFPSTTSAPTFTYKKHHNHHGKNNRICNVIFILPAMKLREVKGVFNTDMIMQYYSVLTNEN